MLGIRHIPGFAVDLWQGEFASFSCDFLLATTPSLALKDRLIRESLQKHSSDAKDIEICKIEESAAKQLLLAKEMDETFLQKALDLWRNDEILRPFRHFAIAAPKCDFLALLEVLYTNMTTKQWHKSPDFFRRRVTIMVDSSEAYKRLFSALCQIFPEENYHVKKRN